jgi:hypothetical protein
VSGDALIAWLAVRRPTPPAGLAERLRAAAEPGDEAVAQRLVQLGVALLDRVARTPAGGRELAADLLAADALVTYAFEAQAEADVAGLAALADRVAAGAGSTAA